MALMLRITMLLLLLDRACQLQVAKQESGIYKVPTAKQAPRNHGEYMKKYIGPYIGVVATSFLSAASPPQHRH